MPKRYSTVYIDGVKMSDPSSVSGDFDFNNILTSQVSRVEILKEIRVQFMVVVLLAEQYMFLLNKENQVLVKIYSILLVPMIHTIYQHPYLAVIIIQNII